MCHFEPELISICSGCRRGRDTRCCLMLRAPAAVKVRENVAITALSGTFAAIQDLVRSADEPPSGCCWPKSVARGRPVASRCP